MIFVTVGTQVPFDRLVRVVDEWVGRTPQAPDVFAQIGLSNLVPKHVAFERFLDPGEFADRIREATAIIAHAGMGSILSALQYGKPVVIMPRRASLREVRNDHQLATATRFATRPGVFVAHDETELPAILDHLGDLQAGEPISPFCSRNLVAALRGFIDKVA